MLVKQVWRILTNPQSMLAKVLKARYFPHSDIFHAQMGPRPSYTWRSINHSKWVLQKGGCWTVGNGMNVKVWEDNWIPSLNGWKKLWKLTIPPRNQVLLWRIIHNIVPVRLNLNNRGVRCSILCPICAKASETIDHVFMKCQKSKKVWLGAQKGLYLSQGNMQFKDWLFYHLEHSDTDTMALIAYRGVKMDGFDGFGLDC
ncbi:putative ribonuclease H protein [Trifolium medium]|uniref:Putative ribonuclease H protein n=1 Tax=Trifolium medium TaxID=97028 RepID=A0A392MTX3_9FABA|nr:putative ribonuclease H protein [Trifolium medium]